ncbi:AAA ATPase domain-containing protein [Geodermatophilus amargosae]|uniref:AAA ATPase domain-containing protein n=1 Tax=Geodermatophilus amargosae TaxID=1296565 RepID=A0A1I7CV76_9ACTN|nr:AAA family ATPase [Geodermatophilus amargosae]SFU03365.1 AAA ATPase domain-containing protein [Geodermatophilus amargosae]
MLHGRGAERARLDGVVAGAAASRGGALVVRGEPGVGKTALLSDLGERTGDATVLWTAGIESESPLAFAALHRLLRPLLGRLDDIPPVQAHALRRALGERQALVRAADAGGDDRFLVFAAVLSLLAEAAEQQPLVCVVDDAHWLDTASAEALLFVARRIAADRIAMVFAVRDDQARRFDGVGLPQLTVSGLDADAADALLAEHPGTAMSGAVRAALRERTGGNPLALVELPNVLSEGQLTGRDRLPAHLPLTEGVERAFLDRSRRLPGDAQTMLLVAAADDSGHLSVVQQAATRLGAGEAALDGAELSGLVRVSGGEVRLRHPLVRSTVYAAATTSQRQAAHRALAAVLVRAGDADRASWHAALATTGPDDVVADGLDAVAERATHRGGHEAASAAAERAAQLSSTAGARATRLLAAARSAWLAGDGMHARELADEARHDTVDPLLRADVDALRGRIEWHIGSPETGRRIILKAAGEVAELDASRALGMRMQATALATWGAGVSPDDEGLDFSLPSLPEASPPRLRCFSALLRGHRHFLLREMGPTATAWREAFRAAETLPPEADLLVVVGIAAMHLGDVTVVQRSYEALLTLARDNGSVTTAVQALSRLPSGRVPTGEWSTAAAAANEALVLARGTGQLPLTTMPLAWVGLLGALRGEASSTDALDELDAILAAQPVGIVGVAAADMAAWAHGESSPPTHPTSRERCTTWAASGIPRSAGPPRSTGWRQPPGQDDPTSYTAGPMTSMRSPPPSTSHGRRRWPSTGERGSAPARTPNDISARRSCSTAAAPVRPPRPEPSWRTASSCAATGAASTPAPTSAPPCGCSPSSEPNHGPSARGRSCERPGPRPASATSRPPGTSQPRNGRQRCSSAPAWPTVTSPLGCSSVPGRWSTT